jgi:hypothetical protein
MNANIKETSLFAYEEIKPHLGKMQQRIYDYIDFYVKYHNMPLPSKQISYHIEKPINSVVARVNELMYEKQLIKIAKVENNQSYYTIRSANDPLNIRKKTPDQKLSEFKSWLKCQGLFVSTTEAIKKIEELCK